MKGFTIGSVTLTLLLNVIQWAVVDAEIVELTPSNYDSLASSGTWFIEHFSPYCPHCVHFAPTWQALGKTHQDLSSTKNFHLGAIDCTVYGDLCHAHKITGYPTIQLYSNGQYIENYAGSREFDVLSAYILTAAEKHASSAANMPDQKPDDVGVNPTGKVVQLTADTFDSKVARGKEPWWIQMYTPWCKHCSQLAPTWDQLATELKGHANVASINCESSKDAKALCLKQGVTGYPTIKFFSGDLNVEYRGPRTVTALAEYTRKANSELQEITGAQLTAIQQDNSVALIHLYTPETKSSLDVIKAVSKHFIDDVPFYITADPISIRHLGYETAELPAAIILKGKHKFVFSSNNYAKTPENEQAIRSWVQKEKFPIISEINLKNAEEILNSNHILAFGLFDGAKKLEDQKKEFKTMTDAWLDKGNKNSNVLFVWLDGTKWADYVKTVFDIKQSQLPRIVIADPKTNQFYPTDSEGRQLSMESPQIVLKSIVEAQTGALTPVTARASQQHAAAAAQIDHPSYSSFVQEHKILTMLIVVVVAGVAYRVYGNKRTPSELLPSTSTKHHE
ncbi:hypothetical protein VKS41_002260 [Umbelopsis sp. WA50703]